MIVSAEWRQHGETPAARWTPVRRLRLSPENVAALVREGAIGASSYDDLIARLEAPRAIWIMVPAGDATEKTVHTLAERMGAGDTIIDGGNSYFKDDVRRAKELRQRGINYLDAGTSGGIWASIAVLSDDRRPDGCGRAPRADLPHAGSGARDDRVDTGTHEEQYFGAGLPALWARRRGHFVKMIHNGIEYGLMQAYAEGLRHLAQRVLDKLPQEHRYDLDLAEIAEVWRRGSVVARGCSI
jgi:6-phosphogluconate dehydrogenase